MQPITDAEGVADELGKKSEEETTEELGGKNEENPTNELKKERKFCQERRIVAFMGFLFMTVAYFARIILSVSITEMVRPFNKVPKFIPILYNETKLHHISPKHSSEYDVEQDKFNWDEVQQQNILSAFYFGYVISHIPGGIYSESFGGKMVLCSSLFVGAISSLMTPVFATFGGYVGLCSCRIIQGISQGVLVPGLSYLLARWIPLKERGRYGSLVYGGSHVGISAGNVISGYMISYLTWDSPFYVAGVLQIILVVAFFLLCTDDPLSNPRITKEEKDYLIAELGDHVKKYTPPKSWKKILRSKPCIAFFVCQICYDWGIFVIVTNLPKYLADVIQVSIETNGSINAAAFFLLWIITMLSGFLADDIYRNNTLTLTNNRKLFTSMSLLVPGLLMVFAVYATRIEVIVFFFITGIGLMGLYYGGAKLTPLDISPNFSPTIMAIGNVLGAITGILAPNIIAIMTPDASHLQWRSVFLLTLFIRFLGTLVVLFFITAERQPWDSPVVVE